MIGGLEASISLDNLSEIIAQKLDLPEHTVLYAVDPTGDLVLHSDTEEMNEATPELADSIAQKSSAPTGWRFVVGSED